MKGAVLGICLVVLLALAPLQAPDLWIGIGLNFLMWLALAASWSIFSGLTGYVSLGHAVFFGLGAYIMAIGWGTVPIVLNVVLAGAGALILAVVVGWPALRVRGPYFVMLTFGIAELVKFVVIAFETHLEQGGRLLLGSPPIETLYYAVLALAVTAVGLLATVRYTRLGAGLRAIREDEVAADTIGVPVVAYKLAAFALSAMIPGMVGAVMLMRAGYFEPLNVFDSTVSLTIICMAVIGGSDRPVGPVFGAVFLVGLSELLWARLPLLYMVILGVILITFVLFAPEGIAGLQERWFASRRPFRLSASPTKADDASAAGQ